MSVLKHKLKTPILGTRRILSLLIEGAFGALNEQQLTVLAALHLDAEKLLVVTDNLVEIYSHQNGIKTLAIEAHQACLLVNPVIANYSAAARARGITFEKVGFSEPLLVECDGHEIQVLLENLIENAVEYARTKVTVSIEARDGRLNFLVADDGRGIAPEDQKTLFSRFYEVSSNGRYPATTGTGLCLCHEIAKAHGGSVSCHSSAKSQTVFCLSLPVSRHSGDEA